MKVCVFGGSGFVGSHVSEALDNAGHEVTIFDRRDTEFRRPRQQFVSGNILDQDAVLDVVQGKDVVYNFAGIADIEEARQRPLDTANVNFIGNATLLDVCRQTGIKRYVFASTIYVYSRSGSFYRASKHASELYIEEYQRQYGLDYTILRYGTLYGRRANLRNNIYRCLQQALVHRKIVYRGDGEDIREYIHVEDAAQSSVDILSDEFKNEHVILTGHQPMKVKDMLVMIREVVGADVEIEYDEPDHENWHYKVTPYSFTPKIGKKLIRHHYLDLGQGLLDCLEEIHGRQVHSKEQTTSDRKIASLKPLPVGGNGKEDI